jgi:hypothetical protein
MAKRSTTVGKALARERAAWVAERERAELVRIREAIRGARQRRKAALIKARATCQAAKLTVQDRVKAFRAAELQRITAEVRRMRNAARAQCQARQHRIRSAGSRVVDRKAAELVEQRRLQGRMARAARHGLRQRSTARERQQEDDDAVRSNLPGELLPVFERVRTHIKGSKRRTRTEAFLEWAEEHPEDVLEYQGDATEREVARLIAEHEATQKRLRKTGAPRARRRRASGDLSDVPF